MRKLSNITESIWTDMQKRSSGEEVRQEDIIKTNIKDISPVDIGVSVLWADKDLEVDDDTYININTIKDFEKDGWRLPSRKEADELLTEAKWSSTRDPHKWSRFYTIGITHIENASDKNIIYFDAEIGKECEYWENEKGKTTPHDCWDTFSFKHDNSFFPHTAYSCRQIEDNCRVRLVKDK